MHIYNDFDGPIHHCSARRSKHYLEPTELQVRSLKAGLLVLPAPPGVTDARVDIQGLQPFVYAIDLSYDELTGVISLQPKPESQTEPIPVVRPLTLDTVTDGGEACYFTCYDNLYILKQPPLPQIVVTLPTNCRIIVHDVIGPVDVSSFIHAPSQPRVPQNTPCYAPSTPAPQAAASSR